MGIFSVFPNCQNGGRLNTVHDSNVDILTARATNLEQQLVRFRCRHAHAERLLSSQAYREPFRDVALLRIMDDPARCFKGLNRDAVSARLEPLIGPYLKLAVDNRCTCGPRPRTGSGVKTDNSRGQLLTVEQHAAAYRHASAIVAASRGGDD